MSGPVQYRITLRDLHAHLVEVEAQFPASGSPVDLWLPVWTPGSYLIREFARHVQDVAATDDAGHSVPIERIDKSTWRVSPGASQSFRIAYRVYANDLSVRTSHVDGTHALLNGTCIFISGDVYRELPCRVTVSAPSGWRTFAALEETNGALAAADYDELVDSPLEIGPHEPITFRASDVPHRLVIWGEGNYDRGVLAHDLIRICEAEMSLFGGSPCREYTFLLMTSDKGRGGLEHANSTALLYPRFGFRPRKAYEEFLSLAAHEYFHLWNVKRIKPHAFVPYSYDRENYTTLLWAMEGITSYYDTLMLRRAGLITAKRYLEKVGEALTVLARTPGRQTLPLADASLLTWVKYYRPDENAPNNQVSYYVKGEIVALLLDLLIRQKTRGTKSLDDVMRLLWSAYGSGKGMAEDGVEAAAVEVAGESVSSFFDQSIRSTEELDYSLLGAVGLALATRPSTGSNDKGGTPRSEEDGGKQVWLGITTKPVDSRIVIASVIARSPAAEGGLYPEDEIVAVDGYRADPASWSGRLQDDHRSGDKVKLTVFRRDRLVDVPVTLAPAPMDACYLEPSPSPDAAAKALYLGWLGEAFPES
jgi:predicted metalloprotease with PDZ domain